MLTKSVRCFFVLTLINFTRTSEAVTINNVKQIYQSEGDLQLALILHKCNNTIQLVEQSLINSAVWITNRLNFLEFTAPFQIGLSIYEICTETDVYKTIFHLFEGKGEKLPIGLISDKKNSDNLQKFTEVLLDFKYSLINNYYNYLIDGSVKLLSALDLRDNVTIFAPNQLILEHFLEISRKEQICIEEYFLYDDNKKDNQINLLIKFNNNTSNSLIIFGDHFYLNQFRQKIKFDNYEEAVFIFVPLDGSIINDLPDNSYIFLPPHLPVSINYEKAVNILPTPLLFKIANPIITFAQNILDLLQNNCNETFYKFNCLKVEYQQQDRENYDRILLSPDYILEVLKIQHLKNNFFYNIYKVNNNVTVNETISEKYNTNFHYNKMFTYKIFDKLLEPSTYILNYSNNVNNNFDNECINFKFMKNLHNLKSKDASIRIRTDPWVFAFLSLSLLGVLFCVSILIFLLTSICKRDILEGNPVLSLLLLVSVMLMYCSVLPLSLDSDGKVLKETICLIRSLSITLTYCCAFSLILSRSILLATAAKDIGFMSHVAGSVQSFLCLFIFGVQAALNLQIIGRYIDIFRGHSFIFLLSYNIMLLLLMLCLCPLIFKCPRNYEEGKYFTIAISIISGIWCIWIPLYGIMGQDWKDPILCFGLISTASILLSTIFIPRTYLMTIAAARDKIASTLPSLATATSTMDIYRTNTQPIYDCVNVAAINAVSIGNGMTTLQQPDLYSCPNLLEDFDDIRCDTPMSTDKVTRF